MISSSGSLVWDFWFEIFGMDSLDWDLRIVFFWIEILGLDLCVASSDLVFLWFEIFGVGFWFGNFRLAF